MTSAGPLPPTAAATAVCNALPGAAARRTACLNWLSDFFVGLTGSLHDACCCVQMVTTVRTKELVNKELLNSLSPLAACTPLMSSENVAFGSVISRPVAPPAVAPSRTKELEDVRWD